MDRTVVVGHHKRLSLSLSLSLVPKKQKNNAKRRPEERNRTRMQSCRMSLRIAWQQQQQEQHSEGESGGLVCGPMPHIAASLSVISKNDPVIKAAILSKIDWPSDPFDRVSCLNVSRKKSRCIATQFNRKGLSKGETKGFFFLLRGAP